VWVREEERENGRICGNLHTLTHTLNRTCMLLSLNFDLCPSISLCVSP